MGRIRQAKRKRGNASSCQNRARRRVLQTLRYFWGLTLKWILGLPPPKDNRPPRTLYEKITPERPFLTLYHRFPFCYRGHEYKSIQHAFASLKAYEYGQYHWSREFREGTGFHKPSAVFAKSQEISKDIEEKGGRPVKRWESKRCTIMLGLVRAKFRASPLSRKHLMETGQSYLLYIWNDGFWGIGREPTEIELNRPPHDNNWGRNVLGNIFMTVRKEVWKAARRFVSISRRARNKRAALTRKYDPEPLDQELYAHFAGQLMSESNRRNAPRRQFLRTMERQQNYQPPTDKRRGVRYYDKNFDNLF